MGICNRAVCVAECPEAESQQIVAAVGADGGETRYPVTYRAGCGGLLRDAGVGAGGDDRGVAGAGDVDGAVDCADINLSALE